MLSKYSGRPPNLWDPTTEAHSKSEDELLVDAFHSNGLLPTRCWLLVRARLVEPWHPGLTPSNGCGCYLDVLGTAPAVKNMAPPVAVAWCLNYGILTKLRDRERSSLVHAFLSSLKLKACCLSFSDSLMLGATMVHGHGSEMWRFVHRYSDSIWDPCVNHNMATQPAYRSYSSNWHRYSVEPSIGIKEGELPTFQ